MYLFVHLCVAFMMNNKYCTSPSLVRRRENHC